MVWCRLALNWQVVVSQLQGAFLEIHLWKSFRAFDSNFCMKSILSEMASKNYKFATNVEPFLIKYIELNWALTLLCVF